MKLKLFAALLCGILAFGMMAGCTPYDPDDDITEGPETSQPKETEGFPIRYTVWKGEEYYVVFMGNDTYILFDLNGEEIWDDSYEWNGSSGRGYLLDQGPYLDIEDGKLVVSGSEDQKTYIYEQTDRIPGTDPADGYFLENSTWTCWNLDKFSFYEDGRVTLRNTNLCYTYKGTYEWDVHEKKGKIVADDYKTDIWLDEDGDLNYVDVEGITQWAGRGKFQKILNFFDLRGQEEEMKGTWYAAESNTWLSFDGTGGATYTDSDGTQFPLREFVHGYLYDGETLTLIIGVDVRTGQPKLAYGSMNSDGSLDVDGVRYERTEK